MTADSHRGTLGADRERRARRPHRRFLREVISELRKVLWPSRNELVTYTIVVIVFVVVMVSIVAGLDIGFAKLVLVVFG